MAINKVSYGNNILIDLTSDTITADKVLQGYTGHDASGASFVGSYIPTSNNGPYVWAVYDRDINSYTTIATTDNATNENGWYQTQMKSSFSIVKVVNGKFHFNKFDYVITSTDTTTMPIGTWISRDGTMCFVGSGGGSGDTNENTLYTMSAQFLHYVVASSSTAYESGLHSDGTYYKPLFDSSYSSMNQFALDTTNYFGAGNYNINIVGLTGLDYGFNGVSFTVPKRVHTTTYKVTSSSPSTTGSMSITGIGFTPRGFVATIVGTGSTNSVCSIVAINTSNATYTRTTSGVATSSPGTKAVTYGNGTLTIPQYNSTYNFKVGTWRIVCWR